MSFNIRNFKRAYIQKLVIDLQKISNIEPVDSCEFNEKNIFLKEVQTTILSHSNFKTIWNWLPDRLTLYHPEVLFSTDVNGTSMNTLLNVLDDLEYCLIVVKTFQGEVYIFILDESFLHLKYLYNSHRFSEHSAVVIGSIEETKSTILVMVKHFCLQLNHHHMCIIGLAKKSKTHK
jgi:hypothetical protein